MQTLGYAYLIDRFRLPVLRQTPVARLSTLVIARIDVIVQKFFEHSYAS